MRIVSRAEWGARYADGFRAAPLPARELWLHHSASAALVGVDAVRALERVGQERFGGGMSYTFLVTVDGAVYEGHSVARQGAHTGGRNDISRSICWVGNFEHLTPTDPMVRATARLVVDGYQRGWWAAPRLTGGHRDVRATACPGVHAYRLIPRVNELATAAVRAGGREVMFESHRLFGAGWFRLNCPVGSASAIIDRAWVSASVDGPEPGWVRVWFQSDTGGISVVEWRIEFADGRSERPFQSVPDGCTMINVEYDFPNGGVVTLEGSPK